MRFVSVIGHRNLHHLRIWEYWFLGNAFFTIFFGGERVWQQKTQSFKAASKFQKGPSQPKVQFYFPWYALDMLDQCLDIIVSLQAMWLPWLLKFNFSIPVDDKKSHWQRTSQSKTIYFKGHLLVNHIQLSRTIYKTTHSKMDSERIETGMAVKYGPLQKRTHPTSLACKTSMRSNNAATRRALLSKASWQRFWDLGFERLLFLFAQDETEPHDVLTLKIYMVLV